MKRAVVLSVAAACGSTSAPAPSADAFDHCAATTNARPTLVHATVSPVQTGSAATISFPPVTGDDLLSFLVVQYSGRSSESGFVALSAIDGIPPYEPSYLVECGKAVEFFGAFGLDTGLASVSFNLMQPGTVQVFALEFESPDRAISPGPAMYGFESSSSPIASTAPSMDVCPNDIVISALVGCGDLGPLMPDTGFRAAGADNSGVAYAIPEARLPYQARWNASGGSWAGFSAQYRSLHSQ